MASVEASARERHARLRAATADLHTSVDTIVAAAGFLSGVPGYTAYLAATHRARAAAEERLAACGIQAIYPAWPGRRIAHLIEEDLTDLGAPIPTSVPGIARPILSKGAMLGALYVLEGSALGARVIAQRVAAFGMVPGFGARHLARQAAHPHAWRDFLTMLNQADLPAAEDEACLEAAMDMFDTFLDHYMTVA